MVYPVLPLEPRTEVSFQSQITPNVTQFNEGHAQRLNRDYRHVTKGQISFSTYTDDLKAINDFLHQQSGYKPFRFPQDNKLYFCSSWTNTFITGNKGTIQLTLTRYTNDI